MGEELKRPKVDEGRQEWVVRCAHCEWTENNFRTEPDALEAGARHESEQLHHKVCAYLTIRDLRLGWVSEVIYSRSG